VTTSSVAVEAFRFLDRWFRMMASWGEVIMESPEDHGAADGG